MQSGSLTEFLVKSLVKNPDMVSVKVFDHEAKITIEVLVSTEDRGTEIGRKGMIASSIRTIVQASSYLNHEKRAVINIDSF